MHPDLSALAEKISKVLSRVAEYVVTQPAELRVLREMSEAEVSEFAKSHGWRVIRRLGGRQIEFYNDASMRTVEPGSVIPVGKRHMKIRAGITDPGYRSHWTARVCWLTNAQPQHRWKQQQEFILLFSAL